MNATEIPTTAVWSDIHNQFVVPPSDNDEIITPRSHPEIFARTSARRVSAA